MHIYFSVMKKLTLYLSFFCMNMQIYSQGIPVNLQLRMLALGDSYTIGQSVDINERWPHQFIAKLREKGVMAEDPDYIATTGWTTKNLLQGMDTKLNTAVSYNMVSILIGVNNQYQGIDISVYEPELREILNRALEVVKYDTSRVFMLSIPDYAYTPFGKGNQSITQGIDAYNAINKRISSEYKINYVDITPISRQGLERPNLVANDGLHPSGMQYYEWVQMILPRIEIRQPLPVSEYTVQQSESELNLQVFPNPASSVFHIYSEKEIEKLRIWKIPGFIVKEICRPSFPLHLDVSEFSPGMYILEGIHLDNRQLIRLILNKVPGS